MSIMKDMPFSQKPDRVETIKYLEDLNERLEETPFNVLQPNYTEQLRATLNYAPTWKNCDTVNITPFPADDSAHRDSEYFEVVENTLTVTKLNNTCPTGSKSEPFEYTHTKQYFGSSNISREDALNDAQRALQADKALFEEEANRLAQEHANKYGVCKKRVSVDSLTIYGIDFLNTFPSNTDFVRLTTKDEIKNYLLSGGRGDTTLRSVKTYNNAHFPVWISGETIGYPTVDNLGSRSNFAEINLDVPMALPVYNVYSKSLTHVIDSITKQLTPFLEYAVNNLDSRHMYRYYHYINNGRIPSGDSGLLDFKKLGIAITIDGFSNESLRKVLGINNTGVKFRYLDTLYFHKIHEGNTKNNKPYYSYVPYIRDIKKESIVARGDIYNQDYELGLLANVEEQLLINMYHEDKIQIPKSILAHEPDSNFLMDSKQHQLIFSFVGSYTKEFTEESKVNGKVYRYYSRDIIRYPLITVNVRSFNFTHSFTDNNTKVLDIHNAFPA